MIINGQRARISDWAWCSGRELGLVEDVATALSFSTTLLPLPLPGRRAMGLLLVMAGGAGD